MPYLVLSVKVPITTKSGAMVNMMSQEKKLAIVSGLVEGVSIRSAGRPDQTRISTSFVERQNLTMRMSMRRFTRLTNGFSKRLSSLQAAVALHFAHYNFCRLHRTLGITPAMAAGVTPHLWDLRDLLAWEAPYSAQASLN